MNTAFNCFLGITSVGFTEILALVAAIVCMVGVIIIIVVAITRNQRPQQATPPAPAPVFSGTQRLCPECGKTLDADAPQGLCPSCLMRGAFTTAPGSSAGMGDTTPPLPADLAAHFPQLEILELLGQGGMGMVYKARQSQLDRFVALKLLPIRDSHDPAFAERFAREARALAKLNHPNIVSVHDFGQTEKYCWFIMEYVDGVNLRQMEQTQRLTPEQAIGIIPKICDALQYAHDEGVVHRDIKPGNILIDKKGRVKIADFGLAKLLSKKEGEAHLTQSNIVMGTPHYMAPEQMNSPLSVDHRADIYSLGVVFYEMLTGELPIGRFAPPSQKVQMDVRLDEVVLRTLESEPARRYQHVSEVRSDVESMPETSGPRHNRHR
ncbi:MAG: pknB 23 [Verrucomicrobia bacterium]|nr:pknB 23 [Verrucomicrobiota bacterium]